MSTAASTPIATTLPERAFSLFCQGLRSPAISHQLGVPERTVRAWIAGIRQDIAASERDRLAEEFFRAIEHLHQLCAAAWAAFEAEQASAHPSSNDTHDGDDPSVGVSGRTPNHPVGAQPAAPAGLRPAANTAATIMPRHGPRYLRLALDAQRQITSLLTHHAPTTSSSLTSETPPASASPSMPAPTPIHTPAPVPITPHAGSPYKTEIPAESAIVPAPLPAGRGAGGEVPMPAESATASDFSALNTPSCSSVSFVSSVLNPRPRPPAKTATAPARKIEIPAKTAIPVASPAPLRDPHTLGTEPLVPPSAPGKEPATRHQPSAPNRRRAAHKSRRARKQHR